MTKFTKETLSYHGGYLNYQPDANDYQNHRFVARFKHRGPVTKAAFVKTLMKHYTVEDYFAKMDAGLAPLQIFQDDGILVFNHDPKTRVGYFILDGKDLRK